MKKTFYRGKQTIKGILRISEIQKISNIEGVFSKGSLKSVCIKKKVLLIKLKKQ